MVTTNEEIQQLHFEHQLWLNELRFFEDELDIYNRRLDDLVSKSDDKEMLAQLEHFQNQFIRQKEVLDTLNHDIKIQEQSLSKAIQNGTEPQTADHDTTKEQMETFQKIYKDLKSDFYRFMAKWN